MSNSSCCSVPRLREEGSAEIHPLSFFFPDKTRGRETCRTKHADTGSAQVGPSLTLNIQSHPLGQSCFSRPECLPGGPPLPAPLGLWGSQPPSGPPSLRWECCLGTSPLALCSWIQGPQLPPAWWPAGWGWGTCVLKEAGKSGVGGGERMPSSGPGWGVGCNGDRHWAWASEAKRKTCARRRHALSFPGGCRRRAWWFSGAGAPRRVAPVAPRGVIFPPEPAAVLCAHL